MGGLSRILLQMSNHDESAEPELLTTKEVAERLKLSRSLISQYAREGRIPHAQRVPGPGSYPSYRFHEADVRKALDALADEQERHRLEREHRGEDN